MAFVTSAPLPLSMPAVYTRHLSLSPTASPPCPRRTRTLQMVDQNVLIGVLVGTVGIGGGVALVAWTENQGKRTAIRENNQPCFECKGETTTTCSVCNGSTKNPLDPEQPCSYCDGAGSIKCLNCKGTGIQPRFLDRFVSTTFQSLFLPSLHPSSFALLFL